MGEDCHGIAGLRSPWFFNQKRGAAAVYERVLFRFLLLFSPLFIFSAPCLSIFFLSVNRFFFCCRVFLPPPHACQFFSSLVFYCSMVFTEKVLLGFHTSPSTFPFLFFFFLNFDFSFFYIFLKASNINIDSTRKISDCKINAFQMPLKI